MRLYKEKQKKSSYFMETYNHTGLVEMLRSSCLKQGCISLQIKLGLK